MSVDRLSVHRTMAAYLQACNEHDHVRAKAILEGTITNTEELALLIESLTGFALACMHTAEGIAAMTGVAFSGRAMLDDLVSKLAMADTIEDVLG